MTGPLASALTQRSVLICVGSGGVGKTTVAASLALRGAALGRRSIVCTVDPAKRLANSLGLEELGNAETRIDDARLAAAGLGPRSPMFAMMLDMKRTWDELISKLAPKEKQERILSNRFYQSLSSALAGSQEYIAMEKLWQLHARSDYQLVVLDTPPTAHALDFLDAPNRLLDFLDNEAARWLLTPALAAGKLGLKLFNLGGSYVARQISKFTGVETLQQLADFMLAVSGMNEDFRERARQTRDLLASGSTAFVLVTGPTVERLDEAVHFHTLLRQNEMAVAAVVVNRVHEPVPDLWWREAAKLSPPLRGKVEKTLEELDVLASQDAIGLAKLAEACRPTALVLVPRFPLDVHDLPALWRTGGYLVGDAQLPAASS
ncbi:MAG: ArsA family ATPase [Myxococcales bacterium]|nr:ArsA family ATPase [Myxococcales bacterium]